MISPNDVFRVSIIFEGLEGLKIESNLYTTATVGTKFPGRWVEVGVEEEVAVSGASTVQETFSNSPNGLVLFTLRDLVTGVAPDTCVPNLNSYEYKRRNINTFRYGNIQED